MKHGLDGLAAPLACDRRLLDLPQSRLRIGADDPADLFEREVCRAQQADQPTGRNLLRGVVAVAVDRIYKVRRQKPTLGINSQRLCGEQSLPPELTRSHQHRSVWIIAVGHDYYLQPRPWGEVKSRLPVAFGGTGTHGASLA